MKTKLSLSEPCKDNINHFGKGFCISIVHSRVNSCLSNNAILENYQTCIKGLTCFALSSSMCVIK